MRSFLLAAAAAMAAVFVAQAPSTSAPREAPVCAACVRATMETLAGDQLRGRKCGSADENAAARYLADALAKLGVKGALAGGAYLQPVKLVTPTYAALPTLDLTANGASLRLTEGREMLASGAPASLDAPVSVVAAAASATAEQVRGKLVVYDTAQPDVRGAAALLSQGAVGVVTLASDSMLRRWNALAAHSAPGPTEVVGGVERPKPPEPPGPLIFVRAETLAGVARFGGGQAALAAPLGEPLVRTTHNVIGVLHGRARDADRRAVLLSAHYDHLGVRDGVVFHGANDDASGTAAVMEFARILGQGKAPRRTAYFALFGCEEEGGLGARYFLAHTPGAVTDIAANLEFEMIGVDDPMRPGFLMLTGWDRSNLGPTLQAHGAKIGPDLYPEQNFFQRSDNYQLALQGVVAQTVSAWPVPPTYHAATDDLAHVDLGFMGKVIGSLIEPVTWLLNSDFQPSWLPGRRP